MKQKTELLDYILGMAFAIVCGTVLGLVYVFRTGGF